MAFALNATGAAAYSICQKPLIESGFKAIFLTAFAMTSAFLPMTVLVVYTIIHDSSRYNDFIPESRQIIALFYCAIGISVVGYAAISYVLSLYISIHIYFDARTTTTTTTDIRIDFWMPQW